MKNIKRKANTRKVFNVLEVIKDESKVVEALYVINKYTKKLRDEKEMQIEKIYGDEAYDHYYPRFILNKMHDKLHNLKYQIENIYNIKSRTIGLLYKNGVLKLDGYHTFDDGCSRDYYTFGIFNFHDNSNYSSNNLGHITGTISQEKELSKMGHKRALEILGEFIKSHELKQVIN